MQRWPVRRSYHAALTLALALALTCAALAAIAAPSPAIVPADRLRAADGQGQALHDQSRPAALRDRALARPRYLSRHRRPSGYSVPRLRARDEAEVPVRARDQGLLRHPPLTARRAAALTAAAARRRRGRRRPPAPAPRARPAGEPAAAGVAVRVGGGGRADRVLRRARDPVAAAAPGARPAGARCPAGLGRVLGSRPVEIAAGTLGVALLALVVVAGFAGSQNALSNFAPTFVFITFWVGLAFASALFGDVFRALNPWRALGRASGRLARRARGERRARRPYPERLGLLAGRRRAARVHLDRARLGLGRAAAHAGRRSSSSTRVATLAAQARLRRRARGRAAARRSRSTSACSRGSRRSPAPRPRRRRAAAARGPAAARRRARDDRVRRRDDRDGDVRRADPGQRCGRRSARALDDALAACWPSRPAHKVVRDARPARVRRARGRLLRARQPLGAPARARSCRPIACGAAFVHSLVPIALVYVAAHYLTFLLFEGQGIAYLLSDPLGRGWDLFGTAVGRRRLRRHLPEPGVVRAGGVRRRRARRRARRSPTTARWRCTARPRAAARSQYAMLAIMVGFTTLALWLLAQAGTA